MKKIEIFFVSIFTLCFCLCAVGINGEFLRAEEIPENSEASEILETESFVTEQMMTEDEVTEETIAGSEEQVPASDEGISEEANESEVTGPEEEYAEELHYFVQTDYDYFSDALFIGDSRAVGLMEYGNIQGADFFAHSGMSVFGVDKKKIEIAGVGKVNFEELLDGKQYGKIYLMLGMNGLGYKFDTLCDRYVQTVERIREKQKDAIIFLCANMHVTKTQSEQDEIYNNDNINKINTVIAGLADEKRLFFIDINEVFDDENGDLDEVYTSDAFHVLGKHYTEWADWLCTKGVVKKIASVNGTE